MSVTTRCSPSAEPGAVEVTPVPKMTEHGEPGGVSCTTRKSAPAAKSASSGHPSALQKSLARSTSETGTDECPDGPRFVALTGYHRTETGNDVGTFSQVYIFGELGQKTGAANSS